MTPAGLAARWDVPVDPDAETAREWARDELSGTIYHERPSLLEQAIRWFLDQLDSIGRAAGALDGRTAALVIGAVLLTGVVIALVVAGPVRRSRAARRTSVEVLGDDERTTTELQESADRHSAEGRWGEAVLDRYRAVLRSLEDRAVLDPRPGRTAHEGAEEAGARLPSCADDLRWAGQLFDDVAYGDSAAGAADDQRLREVAARVATTRPVPTAEVREPELVT